MMELITAMELTHATSKNRTALYRVQMPED